MLYTYNDEHTDNKHKIKCCLKDDKVIKVKITKDKNSMTIFDCYAMLTKSLSSLGNSFEVITIKSKFPSKSATVDNLFYEGSMPSIECSKDISDVEYKYISVKKWFFKDKTVKYLNNDLLSLHEILTKANKQIFLYYNTYRVGVMTISGLAVRIFLKDYYKNNIPNINKFSFYKDIKQAYFRGITEVYKPWGKDLYYYHVNTLYPYVALQDMPGLTCNGILFYTDTQDIDTLFGLFYCSIDAPLDGYLGFLLIRTSKGLNIPLARWKGWYFSVQWKFAKKHGYKIQSLKGYNFNKESNVFTDYINHVYNIK